MIVKQVSEIAKRDKGCDQRISLVLTRPYHWLMEGTTSSVSKSQTLTIGKAGGEGDVSSSSEGL